MTKPIPIQAAKDISDAFGYDQVVIVARKCGKDGLEHVTTYGRSKQHCDVAARIGEFFKFKLMGWKPASVVCPDPEAHEKGDLLLPCDHEPAARPQHGGLVPDNDHCQIIRNGKPCGIYSDDHDGECVLCKGERARLSAREGK